jgi:membrane associated rhomboid family serine protease
MASRFSFRSPGRRGPSDPWFLVGTVEVTTSVFVVALGVISMFVWAADKTLFEPIILWPYKIRHGQLWRLVTWPVANEPNLYSVLDLVFFWFFGRELERAMDRVRYTKYLLALIVIPAVVATGLDLPAAGLRPIALAVFVAFVVESPNARLMFGIAAKWFAIVLVGIEVLQRLGDRDNKGLAFLAVTLVVAVVGLRFVGLGSNVAWIPAPSGRPKQRPVRKAKPTRTFRGDTVVPGPWAASGGDQVQAEIDRLLDKIAASGLDSLTPDERRRLNDASKRLRGE